MSRMNQSDLKSLLFIINAKITDTGFYNIHIFKKEELLRCFFCLKKTGQLAEIN